MIVITTPTGDIGSQVVAGLLDAGEDVRVIARDPSKLSGDVRAAVEVVEGSHGDRAVVDEALPGAEAVFWLPPPRGDAASIDDLYVGFAQPVVDSFAAHGVARVVGISALGRGTPQQERAGHVTATLKMDDLIAASGVAYRAVVNPSFMENLLGQVDPIREQGMFFGLARGDHEAPTCATRDIAAASVQLLRDASWTGFAEHPVLGPEDLSPDEQAQIVSDVLGREVRYQQVPADGFKAQMTGGGMSDAVAQALVDMLLAKDEGLDAGVERTPQTSSPTSFRAWCEDTLKPAVEG